MKRKQLLILLLVIILSACGQRTQPASLEDFAPALRSTSTVNVPSLENAPRYRIQLTAQPRDNTLTGKVTIRYVNIAPAELREVYLRLYPNMRMYGGTLNISRAAADGKDVPFVLTGKGTDLKIPLPRTLSPQHATVLEVHFTLNYPDLKGEYDFFGARDGIAILPDFYPMLAPLIGGEWRVDPSPGYGDAAYADISLYDLEITAPEGYQVLLPGQQIEQEKTADGITYHIVTGPARNIGMVLAMDYEQETVQVGDVSITSLALPQDRTTSRAALAHAQAVFTYCEDNFGPYPAKQLLLVRAPLQNGVVHLSGMILLSSRLYNEERTDLEQTVANNIIRQWWGVRVSNDPFRAPWLDEALAGYTTMLYLRQTHGADSVSEMQQAWRDNYQQAVKSGEDTPLSEILAAYGNSASYELLVNNKGPLFWLSAEEMFGQEGVLTILRQLQQEHAFGSMTTESFIATFNRIVGPPGEALLKAWVTD